MGTPGKARQKAYRRRRQEGGCRQVNVWLNTDAYTALQLLLASQHADASTVISDALRHYHAVTGDKASVTSDAAADNAPVTSDKTSVTSDTQPVTGDVTSDKLAVTGNRYMSQALEDHILTLRQSGLSLSAIARQLADEGHLNAKGVPYSTATVSKAEARAKARQCPADAKREDAARREQARESQA